MGAPISPLFSDIYMNKYDVLINDNKKWKKNILTYHRFVDEIFIIWIGTDRELKKFVSEINQLNPNMYQVQT